MCRGQSGRRHRRCHPRQKKNKRTVATTEQQQSSNIIERGGEHAPTPDSFSDFDGWKSERTWTGNRSTSIEWRAMEESDLFDKKHM